MNYLDRPLVVELAQLALDAYNSPSDDKLRENEFNPLWIRKDQWPRTNDIAKTTIAKIDSKMTAPGSFRYTDNSFRVDFDVHTGFYAAFYEHMVTGVGVFVIRGTDFSTYLDLFQDINYVFNFVMNQYEEAKSFWLMVRDHYLTAGLTKIYVCGHSLGGIVAKMIAPITGRDTIAFNSPGVMEYLINNDLPSHLNFERKGLDRQRVITYCAKADPIGNLRHDNDFEPYNFVDVLGGRKIPDKDDRLKNIEFIKDSVYDGHKPFLLTKYHKMIDMYEALKNSEYQHDAI